MLSSKCDYNIDECDVIGIDPIETFENILPITQNETINSIVSSKLLELEEQSQPDKTFYQYDTDNIDEPNEFKQEPSELPFIELIPLVSLKQNESFEHIEQDEFYKYIKWSKKILQLNIRDLNIYIKNNKLNTIQIKYLKIQRRRMMNCRYSHNYRARKQ
jgi:hypothetical protein